MIRCLQNKSSQNIDNIEKIYTNEIFLSLQIIFDNVNKQTKQYKNCEIQNLIVNIRNKFCWIALEPIFENCLIRNLVICHYYTTDDTDCDIVTELYDMIAQKRKVPAYMGTFYKCDIRNIEILHKASGQSNLSNSNINNPLILGKLTLGKSVFYNTLQNLDLDRQVSFICHFVDCDVNITNIVKSNPELLKTIWFSGNSKPYVKITDEFINTMQSDITEWAYYITVNDSLFAEYLLRLYFQNRILNNDTNNNTDNNNDIQKSTLLLYLIFDNINQYIKFIKQLVIIIPSEDLIDALMDSETLYTGTNTYQVMFTEEHQDGNPGTGGIWGMVGNPGMVDTEGTKNRGMVGTCGIGGNWDTGGIGGMVGTCGTGDTCDIAGAEATRGAVDNAGTVGTEGAVGTKITKATITAKHLGPYKTLNLSTNYIPTLDTYLHNRLNDTLSLMSLLGYTKYELLYIYNFINPYNEPLIKNEYIHITPEMYTKFIRANTLKNLNLDNY